MARDTGMTAVRIWEHDRDRLNTAAALLTRTRPGKFGQAEAIKWMLDSLMPALLTEAGPPPGNNDSTDIAWNE